MWASQATFPSFTVPVPDRITDGERWNTSSIMTMTVGSVPTITAARIRKGRREGEETARLSSSHGPLLTANRGPGRYGQPIMRFIFLLCRMRRISRSNLLAACIIHWPISRLCLTPSKTRLAEACLYFHQSSVRRPMLHLSRMGHNVLFHPLLSRGRSIAALCVSRFDCLQPHPHAPEPFARFPRG